MDDSKTKDNTIEKDVKKKVNLFFETLENEAKKKGEDISEYREFEKIEKMFKFQLDDEKLSFKYNIKELNQNIISSVNDKMETEEELDEFTFLVNQISADTSNELNTNLASNIEDYYLAKIDKYNKILYDKNKLREEVSENKEGDGYFNHYLVMKQVENMISNYLKNDYEEYERIVKNANNSQYASEKNNLIKKINKNYEKIKGIKGIVNEYLKEYVLTRQEKWLNNLTGNIKMKKINKLFRRIKDKIWGGVISKYKIMKRLKIFFGVVGFLLWIVDNSFGYRAMVKFFNIFENTDVIVLFGLQIMGENLNLYIRILMVFILILLITIIFKLFIGRIFEFSVYSKDIKIHEENIANNKNDINRSIKDGIKNIFGFSYPMNLKYTKTNSIFLVIGMFLSFLIISAFIIVRIADIYAEGQYKMLNDISSHIISISTDSILSGKLINLLLLIIYFVVYFFAIPILITGIGFLLPMGCSISFHIMFTYATIESKEKNMLLKREEYKSIITECKKAIDINISNICYYMYGIVRIEGDIMIKLKEIFISNRNKFLSNTIDEIIWRIIQKTHLQN